MLDDDDPREIIKLDENLSESIKARKNYRDVSAAAQEAFESAAYAAAAARAAVELSRTQPPQDSDSDNESGSDSDSEDAIPDFPMPGNAVSEGNELGFENVHPINKYSSESEGEDNGIKETKQKQDSDVLERTVSSSSSDSDEKKLNQDLGDKLGSGRVNTNWDVLNEDESKFENQSSKLTNTDQSLNFEEELHSQHSQIRKKGVSMRTRREH